MKLKTPTQSEIQENIDRIRARQGIKLNRKKFMKFERNKTIEVVDDEIMRNIDGVLTKYDYGTD